MLRVVVITADTAVVVTALDHDRLEGKLRNMLAGSDLRVSADSVVVDANPEVSVPILDFLRNRGRE